MLTSEVYSVYRQTDRDLTKAEQEIADESMLEFLDDYKEYFEIVTLSIMPFTTLTVHEYDRVEDLLSYKMGGGLWARYLS